MLQETFSFWLIFAQVHLSHAGVMIRDHVVVRDPRVDVDMLELGFRLRQRGAHCITSEKVSQGDLLGLDRGSRAGIGR